MRAAPAATAASIYFSLSDIRVTGDWKETDEANQWINGDFESDLVSTHPGLDHGYFIDPAQVYEPFRNIAVWADSGPMPSESGAFFTTYSWPFEIAPGGSMVISGTVNSFRDVAVGETASASFGMSVITRIAGEDMHQNYPTTWHLDESDSGAFRFEVSNVAAAPMYMRTYFSMSASAVTPAVPEPEVNVLLALGLGLVALRVGALRRRQIAAR